MASRSASIRYAKTATDTRCPPTWWRSARPLLRQHRSRQSAEGLQIVERQLQGGTLHTGEEEEPLKALSRDRGSVRILDSVRGRLQDPESQRLRHHLCQRRSTSATADGARDWVTACATVEFITHPRATARSTAQATAIAAAP